MATTDEIISRTAPGHLIDHNLIDKEVESLCDGMVRYEKRPATRRDGSVAEGIYNAWIDRSLGRLAQLMPARYAKGEISSGFLGSIDRYAYSAPVPKQPAPAAATTEQQAPPAPAQPVEAPAQPAAPAPDQPIHTTRVEHGATTDEVKLATAH